MNARNLTALFVAITLFVPSLGHAGQALGTAKARGDFRPFSQSQQSVARSVRQSRPASRYSAPQSAPVIARTPMIQEEAGAVIAQAPVEARRFSQAPADENQTAVTTSGNPCQGTSVASAPSSSGRRYSYAPDSSAPAMSYSGSPARSYSGNVGRSSQPLWSLPKTDSRKFNAR